MPISIRFNVSLQPHNSMAVQAEAYALVSVYSLGELNEALDYARDQVLDVLVLGEGSNTVFENDYRGLVVLNRLKGIELVNHDSCSVIVKAAAGENWHEFVQYAIEQGWFGLENLALIPGLVGAAPIQNIGAYGVEVKDTIVGVEYIDVENQKVKIISNECCHFAYRESIFKHELAGKVVITSVTFKLTKNANVNVSYPVLANQFQSEPTPKQVFDMVCKIRKSKLPLPKDVPNAGSFFKNPVVDDLKHSELKALYPDLVSYPTDKGFKLAAGWMIEKAGWKSKNIDGVSVHSSQALVIVNPEKRSGKEVVLFAEAVVKDIFTRFSVLLEVEPRIYR